MGRPSVADVTVHVDETLAKEARAELERALRSRQGVVSIRSSEKAPHLFVVGYDPDLVTSKAILDIALRQCANAELLGL